jgi:hypothetical protein
MVGVLCRIQGQAQGAVPAAEGGIQAVNLHLAHGAPAVQPMAGEPGEGDLGKDGLNPLEDSSTYGSPLGADATGEQSHLPRSYTSANFGSRQRMVAALSVKGQAWPMHLGMTMVAPENRAPPYGNLANTA